MIEIPRRDPDAYDPYGPPPRPTPVFASNTCPDVVSLSYFADSIGVSTKEARMIRAKMADATWLDPPVVLASGPVPEAEDGIHKYTYVDHLSGDSDE